MRGQRAGETVLQNLKQCIKAPLQKKNHQISSGGQKGA